VLQHRRGMCCILTVHMLLQVLSVQTALSIQSHPDKSLAERLHAERPDVREPSHRKYSKSSRLMRKWHNLAILDKGFYDCKF
jgi:hypothetical protein